MQLRAIQRIRYKRPHIALDDRTSAEVTGIKVEGSNKWLTLIQNAKRNDGN
ncbi:MAG: hypothetical protein WB643_13295 [Candidatus Bathyarchaeia archaeon]